MDQTLDNLYQFHKISIHNLALNPLHPIHAHANLFDRLVYTVFENCSIAEIEYIIHIMNIFYYF